MKGRRVQPAARSALTKPVGVNPGVSLERGRLATPSPFGALACRWSSAGQQSRGSAPSPAPANSGGPVLRECALTTLALRFGAAGGEALSRL